MSFILATMLLVISDISWVSDFIFVIESMLTCMSSAWASMLSSIFWT